MYSVRFNAHVFGTRALCDLHGKDCFAKDLIIPIGTVIFPFDTRSCIGLDALGLFLHEELQPLATIHDLKMREGFQNLFRAVKVFSS